MKKSFILLYLITLIGFGLRIYNLTNNPPALSWDEVSIGYNAYSILKTGRDEHGRFFPLDTFIAYGDYKPPLSIYITVPFVSLFGLNELAVRLPSALSGTLTVFLTYFIVIELFRGYPNVLTSKDKREKKNRLFVWGLKTEVLALLSETLLALSPWHINLSRAGFEANIALFFVLLGVFLFLYARRKPNIWLVGWLPFVAAMYTFNSSRYFIFILSLSLVLFCMNEIIAHWRHVIVGLVIAGLVTIPIIPHLLSKEARLRFIEVNIFSDSSIVKTSNDRIQQEGNSFVAKILHNRRIGYVRSFIIHFFDNLQPDFLFIKGDGNPKFSTQDVGQLYLIEAPFFALGFLVMFIAHPNIAFFLLIWLLGAIVPAALARETPHALRILNSLPTWHIFIAYGIMIFLSRISRGLKGTHGRTNLASLMKRSIYSAIVVGIGIVYVFQITYYLYNYHIHYPRIYAAEWQFGYKQAFEYLKMQYDSYDHIYITDSIGRPYMYALFYTQYDPARFQHEKKPYVDAAGFYHVDSFDKYIFVKELPAEILPKSLLVGSTSWVNSTDRILQRIWHPNGTEALIIFQRT